MVGHRRITGTAARLVQGAHTQSRAWRTWVAGITVVIAALWAEPGWTQPPVERWQVDSLGVAADAEPLPVDSVSTECAPIWLQVVRDTADATEIGRFRGCGDSAFPALGRELYVHVVQLGDCHARHEVRASRSESRREYRIEMITWYGGCRSGRVKAHWIRLPPLPEGWTVAFTDRRINREW